MCIRDSNMPQRYAGLVALVAEDVLSYKKLSLNDYNHNAKKLGLWVSTKKTKTLMFLKNSYVVK